MCTGLIIGKAATRDGISILARNEDFKQQAWPKYLKFRQHPGYAEEEGCLNGNQWVLGNGLEVPIPTVQYQYSACPDAAAVSEACKPVGDYFFFEERGVNENNVALSATNSMEDNLPDSEEDRARNNITSEWDPYVQGGIEESIIATLILPQAESASDGVIKLGEYIETYGAAEGNAVLFGDLDECWYMEIGSGHCWIAVRVPDEQYVVVANSKRIHDVDLTECVTDSLTYGYRSNVPARKTITDHPISGSRLSWMCSPLLYKLATAKERSLLIGPAGKPLKLSATVNPESFDFAGLFGCSDSKENGYYNVDRIWRAISLLSPSLVESGHDMYQPRKRQYPLFITPDDDVTVSDVMLVLRASFAGTALAMTEPTPTRPIGVYRTAESHIMTLDKMMPKGLEAVIWQTLSSPIDAPYIPIFNALHDYPEAYACGDEQTYSLDSAYWAFKGLFGLESVQTEGNEDYIRSFWSGTQCDIIKQYDDYIAVVKTNAENHPTETAISFSMDLCKRLFDQTKNYQRQLLTHIIAEMRDPYETAH